jgi:hypothetical protein
MNREKQLFEIVEFGRYKKAVVTAVQLGDAVVYRVVQPGRLNGRPILDFRKNYSMDAIFRVNQNINRKLGVENPSRWTAFVDEVQA